MMRQQILKSINVVWLTMTQWHYQISFKTYYRWAGTQRMTQYLFH